MMHLRGSKARILQANLILVGRQLISNPLPAGSTERMIIKVKDYRQVGIDD